MKKEFNVKSFHVRSFMVSGLTAKWGIGAQRDERYKKPLHAWTIKGRADGSTDFTPLPDLMGGGLNMNLSGFTGDAGSGFENGYLMFDGVDDAARTASFTIGKDFTVVGDWTLPQSRVTQAGITKGASWFIYSISGSRIQVFINTGSRSYDVKGEDGLNAVCSDGRIYGKTWELYLNKNEKTVTGSNSSMVLGCNGGSTSFTTMKFKNLAIYDSVLSEEQCKKAYDWLQEQIIPVYKYPTHAWTARGRLDGIGNVSPLYDLSGAGLDLTLKGFDGTGGSGFSGGKLLLDGVDDQLSTEAFSHSSNFTVVAEYEMLDDKAVNCGIRKAYAVYVYNKSATELRAGVNTPSYIPVKSRSLKALTSVGKMYDENWNEIDSPNPVNPNPVSTNLMIGSTGSAYTKMSFSCLAFYDGVAFDKAMCQKALDWLKEQSHG